MRTERLVFHSWRPADLDDAFRLWGNPQVMALLGGVLDPDRIRQRLAREMASQREHGFQYWRLTMVSEEFIGCCGLKYTELEDATTVLEMGFHLMPQAWGQGIAGEAARAVVGHAFTQLRAPSLFAGHHPENQASQRVLSRLGFQRVGERFWPPTGLMHPWYELTAR